MYNPQNDKIKNLLVFKIPGVLKPEGGANETLPGSFSIAAFELDGLDPDLCGRAEYTMEDTFKEDDGDGVIHKRVRLFIRYYISSVVLCAAFAFAAANLEHIKRRHESEGSVCVCVMSLHCLTRHFVMFILFFFCCCQTCSCTSCTTAFSLAQWN